MSQFDGAVNPEWVAEMDKIRQAFRQGQASLAQVVMIPPEELNATYSVGLRLLALNKNHEAASVFSMLTIYDPYDVRFWRAMGLALMRGQRWRLGIRCLTAALALNDQDLPSLTYRGEAYILDKRHDDARADLEIAVTLGRSGQVEDVPFINRAQGLLRFLSQPKSG